MNKIAIAVHGGAGAYSAYVRDNRKKYEEGLSEAASEGHAILKAGGNAVDAVAAAVVVLEDNPIFNAGKGSALTIAGAVEMDAAIMDGKTRKAGAVALAKNVKNPVELAKMIMLRTNHVMLSGPEALNFARQTGLALEDDDYFKTAHQWEEFMACKSDMENSHMEKRKKGTVGAVALDHAGNVAAATSTGGTSGCLPGRVGDSCIIGAGCFADNDTCAVSGTGDGELLITGVISHAISMMVKYKSASLQEACDRVVLDRRNMKGDVGVISVNRKGEIGISFTSERMHRAWIDGSGGAGFRIN